MQNQKRYVGINNEINGGMTDTAKIIRDAWTFGLIPEEETCEGWMVEGLEELWRKVNEEWSNYGFQVARLPDEIQQRFMRIQEQAMKQARASGWDGDAELQGDD